MKTSEAVADLELDRAMMMAHLKCCEALLQACVEYLSKWGQNPAKNSNLAKDCADERDSIHGLLECLK